MTSFLVLFIWGLSQRSCSGDCANISWLGRRSGKPWRYLFLLKLSSVQFSRSVVSDSLRPHESQHARPPCPSPTPGVCSNSCPSSRWCHPPSHPLSSPSPPTPNASQHQGLFPVSQLFTSGGQSIGVSASASVLPMNTQDWSPLGWTGWTSLQTSAIFHSYPSPSLSSPIQGPQNIQCLLFRAPSRWDTACWSTWPSTGMPFYGGMRQEGVGIFSSFSLLHILPL